MINQVPNANFNNKFVFDNRQNKPSQNFFIAPETMQRITGNVAGKDKKKEKDSTHTFGLTLGISALVVGGLMFMLMRGAPKGTNKYLNKFREFLENKIEKTNNSKLGKFYSGTLKRVNSFISKCESVNNFTALKDIGCKRLMYKTKFTRKIHEVVTGWFDKASHYTVRCSWNKTKNKFTSLFKSMDSLNEKALRGGSPAEIIEINGVKKSRYDWYQILKQEETLLNDTVAAQSSPGQLAKRYTRIHEATNGLDEFAWKTSFGDVRNFSSRPMWETFLADEFIKPGKVSLMDDMRLIRNKMAYSVSDKHNHVKSFIQKVESMVNPQNTDSLALITNLKRNLRLSKNPEKYADSIDELRKSIAQSADKMKCSPEDIKNINVYLDEAQKVLASNDVGAMQRMLSIYEKLLPAKDYQVVQSSMNRAVKALDKSIDTEAVQYFEKVRDLVVGSAPTDVISIAGTGGVVWWGLKKAKDKDERTSISLKYGIPAVGAVATSVYCTASLLSGTKSLIFGALAGVAFNKVGAYVDRWRKQHQADRKLPQIPSGANAV